MKNDEEQNLSEIAKGDEVQNLFEIAAAKKSEYEAHLNAPPFPDECRAA